MKWRKKAPRSENSSSSSSSSSFSISSVLPFSWISKLKLLNTKPKHEPNYIKTSPPPPPPSPPRHPPPYIHPSFSCDSRIFLDKSPPSVHGCCDATRRLSLDGDIVHRARRSNNHQTQHYSIGNDFEMLTLGHHIPFSKRWVEAEPETDDSRLGRRKQSSRPRRRSKVTISLTEAAEPRRSFKYKNKVRIRSPRSAAASAGAAKSRRELERFAVVKCSSDPQRDFRESMVEMIGQRGIGRPQELESLLACYLMLNSDEHHDVIVKVFRQVWFEMKSQRTAASKFRN